jgi:undecaprenyl phosphate-alpha-L-ara4FN deformylase
MSYQLALKIDVDTLIGTEQGVPRLVELLQRHGAGATFLFSLGPDHTGRAIKRVFRPGFLQKVSRTSVVEHYGWKTLTYGTLLPGPDIGARCADLMRGVRGQGFEVGIHSYDHVKWQEHVAARGAAWTEREMLKSLRRFRQIFGVEPKTHGAAGWQTNLHALRLTQRLEFDYCSDCRGSRPFIPMWNAEIIDCPQLPTTLPTLDELLGRDGMTTENVADRLLSRTAQPPRAHHVFTLHAELEGMKLIPVFERLLLGWKAQGYELVALRGLYQSLDRDALPRCEVGIGEVPGRSGTLTTQGKPFLGLE